MSNIIGVNMPVFGFGKSGGIVLVRKGGGYPGRSPILVAYVCYAVHPRSPRVEEDNPPTGNIKTKSYNPNPF